MFFFHILYWIECCQSNLKVTAYFNYKFKWSHGITSARRLPFYKLPVGFIRNEPQTFNEFHSLLYACTVQGDSRIVSDLEPLFLQHKLLSHRIHRIVIRFQKNETIVSNNYIFVNKSDNIRESPCICRRFIIELGVLQNSVTLNNNFQLFKHLPISVILQNAWWQLGILKTSQYIVVND
jgi:hypothetical protein